MSKGEDSKATVQSRYSMPGTEYSILELIILSLAKAIIRKVGILKVIAVAKLPILS